MLAIRLARSTGFSNRTRCFCVSVPIVLHRMYDHRRPCAAGPGLGQGSLVPRAGALRAMSTTGEAQPRPYSELPGPFTVPVVGSAWEFLLKRNRVRGKEFFQLQEERHKQYGPIYKDSFVGVGPFVAVHDPGDMEKVFRAEGKHPRRFSVKVLIDVRKELGIGCGIFLLDGEEWHKQRVSISKFSMMPRKIAEFHDGFNTATKELLEAIEEKRDKSMVVHDASSLLFKWSFENMYYFVLGRKIGCLDVKNTPPEVQQLINNFQVFLKYTEKILFSPAKLHQLVGTKQWKTLRSSLLTVYNIALKNVEGKLQEVREDLSAASSDDEPPEKMDFITYLMLNGKLTPQEIALNAIDFLLAGIDTTSYTLAWTLYCLSNSREEQEKLREEVQSALEGSEDVTSAHISKMPFMKDCIREALRMHPLVPGHTRYLSEDTVLSGYKIPAGTLVLMPMAANRECPDYFSDPECYKPDRWRRGSDQVPNAFLSLPFGFGPRMCVGRRIAEQELYIALAHIMRRFRVEYAGDRPLGLKQQFILVPDGQMDLRFITIN